MFLPFPDRTRIVQDSVTLGQMQLFLRLRIVRSALGFICVAAVLLVNGTGPMAWGFFVAASFGWPLLATSWAMRSRDHERIEISSLLIDSALGGVWVALMQFNLLPSALLTVMLANDKVIVGGWSFLLRGLLVQAAACELTLAIHGFAFVPRSSMAQLLVTLPMLIGYPLAVRVLARSLHTFHARGFQRSLPAMRADEAPGS